MNKLQYSPDALNALYDFHGKKHIVYVEGQDDILFWKYVFNQNGLHNIYIKEAGGNNEIEKYVTLILDNKARLIVARDSHYCDILKDKYNHPCILYTFGYSIENSLFSPICVATTIQSLSKTQEIPLAEIEPWFDEFCDCIRTLVIQDIASIKYQKSLSILCETCARFLTNSRSHRLSSTKIEEFSKSLEGHFFDKEIQIITKLLDDYDKDLRYLVRGHFMQIAIINLIRYAVKKKTRKAISISKDSLFALLVSIFYVCCKNTEDVHYLETQIDRLKRSINLK